MLIPLTFTSALVPSLLIVSTIIYYLRADGAEYVKFKSQTDTASRQSFYRKWTVQSFLLYTVATIVLLGLFGRLNALVEMPREFADLSFQIGNLVSPDNEVFSPNFIWILACSFIVSAIASPTIIAYLSRRKTETILAGDVEPLLPKNKAERRWAFVISLNAGISEELYFRLLLPLLLTYVFDNAFTAFAVSAVLFGLIHLYQGWIGVIATTLFGTLLTLVYIGTGNIWLVVVAHALLDMNGLLLQPFLRAKLN